MVELTEKEKISLIFEEAGDAFTIANEVYQLGDIEALKREYPRMKDTIQKGLVQLRMVVL